MISGFVNLLFGECNVRIIYMYDDVYTYGMGLSIDHNFRRKKEKMHQSCLVNEQCKKQLV